MPAIYFTTLLIKAGFILKTIFFLGAKNFQFHLDFHGFYALHIQQLFMGKKKFNNLHRIFWFSNTKLAMYISEPHFKSFHMTGALLKF